MGTAPQMPMGMQQNPATAGMGARPAPSAPQPQPQAQGGLAGMDPSKLAGLLQMFKGSGANTNPAAGLLTGPGGIFGGGLGSNINWNQYITPGSAVD